MDKSVRDKADALIDKEKYAEAIRLYDQLIQSGCIEPLVYARRGYAKFYDHNYSGAIADFNEALDTNPGATTTWFFRARAKEELGDLEGAMEDYRRSAELDPFNADTYMNRGLIEQYRGNMAEASAYYKKALELDPECKVARNGLEEIDDISREST